jgi:hypothetical protein
MTDGRSKSVPKPSTRRPRWTSFVAAPLKGRAIRGLQEEDNPSHRVRVTHNPDTLLVHISNEGGDGWTTLVIDRATREWAVAQRERQLDAAEAAYNFLYTNGGAIK